MIILFSVVIPPRVGLTMELSVGLMLVILGVMNLCGFMRWLTIHVPGEEREILLERPGQPVMDEKTAAQVRDLVTKGRAGGHLFFTTDDCRGTYEELRARGVEFSEEPTERPYGIDCGLRDPFGNHIRFSQPTAQA